MEELRIFCPATIANISCGFDVLGLCLESIGDEMIIRKIPERIIRIGRIEGADLPVDCKKNVAGVAAMAMYKELHIDFGFEIDLIKKIKPGSGIGSSAASAAGAVFGLNAFLDTPLKKTALIHYAMEGEKLASGALHADNVGPALLGGFTLIRSYNPIDIISLNVPKNLYITVIHPHVEIRTQDARAVLKKNVSLKKATQQWGNLAALISGLYTKDYSLISRSLEDVIVEPHRSVLIPKFKELKEAIAVSNALGGGIAGSGPSVFALSQGETTAKKVAENFKKVFKSSGIYYQVHISAINKQGIKILNK